MVGDYGIQMVRIPAGSILGYIWAVYGPLHLAGSMVLWDQGVSVGGRFGVHFSHIWNRYTIPIRARAYNDCVKVPILLKTRSSGGPGYPRLNVFWGL